MTALFVSFPNTMSSTSIICVGGPVSGVYDKIFVPAPSGWRIALLAAVRRGTRAVLLPKRPRPVLPARLGVQRRVHRRWAVTTGGLPANSSATCAVSNRCVRFRWSPYPEVPARSPYMPVAAVEQASHASDFVRYIRGAAHPATPVCPRTAEGKARRRYALCGCCIAVRWTDCGARASGGRHECGT